MCLQLSPPRWWNYIFTIGDYYEKLTFTFYCYRQGGRGPMPICIYIYICVYTYMYSIYHYKSIHWKPPEIHQPNFFKFIKGSISLWTETRPRTAVKTPMLLAWAQGSWTKTQKYVYIYIGDRYGIWYSAHLYKVATFGNLQPNKKSNNMSPTSIGSQYTLKIHTNVPPLDPLAFKNHHLQ